MTSDFMYSEDASALGLRPGSWPLTLVFEGRRYTRGLCKIADGSEHEYYNLGPGREILSVSYFCEAASGRLHQLDVLND